MYINLKKLKENNVLILMEIKRFLWNLNFLFSVTLLHIY